MADRFLVAGFIDLQINGGLGHDFTSEPESIFGLARQLPRWGCTAFLPTLITSQYGQYQNSLKVVKEAQRETQGARVLGAHLEGPYLNQRYKGAHDARYLRSPDLLEIRDLVESGVVKLVTMAPELSGALEVVRYLTGQGIAVSAGHSAATYEEAQAGFEAGITYVTHLFNAMPGLHHRAPGLVAAALDPHTPNRPYLGLILDGIHVNPAILRSLNDRLIDQLTLVTDAVAGMGMPPGRYTLAGQEVMVDENSARLVNDQQTLAGSILTLDRAVRNATKFLDLPLSKALALVTSHPAAVLSLSNRLGELKAGMLADLVVLDQNLEVEMTLVNGQIVYRRS